MHQRIGKGIIRLLELALISTGLLLVILGAEQAAEDNDAAREAELKANLHNIQLSLERFAVDTVGSYPQYLIGGEARWAATVSPADKAGRHFRDIEELDPDEQASDPLIRRGYMDGYPNNPFAPYGLMLHQLQEELPFGEMSADPLRNGAEAGQRLGTRFGAECNLMGSVMADPRFEAWVYVDREEGVYYEESTFANIEYPCWDLGTDADRRPQWLPGQFFYKGAGPMLSVGGNTAETEAILPTEINMYIMGAYGSAHANGKDIIGTEEPISFTARVSGKEFGVMELELWPWTRSVVRTDHTAREGSPYSPHVGDGHYQLDYGSPNGIRDGVVLVLTAGSC